MSEMEERVARALARSAGAKMTGPGRHRASDEIAWRGDGAHLDEYVDLHWPEHVHAATFAIEAMREPTDAMIDAAMRPYVHGIDEQMRNAFRQTIKGYWQAMIDATLK